MHFIDLKRLLLPLATLLCTASAHAGVSIVGTGTPGGLTASDATTLSVQRGGGAGHVSLIPYFSTQGGNSTLINIVNMDTNGKAVKIRFRGAGNGDTLSDLTLLMAPRDTWSVNVSSDGSGASFSTVTDTSCTLPGNVNAPFNINRLPLSLPAAEKAAWTREGMVEVITMADIPSGDPDSSPLLKAITSSSPTLRGCDDTPERAAALDALRFDPPSEVAARRIGLDTPTTGVRVTSILINIQNAALSWSTPTTSLVWLNSAGAPARGRLVFSPQTADPAPNADLFTNDPLLRSVTGGGGSRVQPRQTDLPDLSTPYAGTSANAVDLPFRQTEQIANALKVSALRNEFLREPTIGAVTDWTVSQPIKRYAVAVDYAAAAPALVFNQAPAGPSSYYQMRTPPSPAGTVDLLGNLSSTSLTFDFWDAAGGFRANPFGIVQAGLNVNLAGNVGVFAFDSNGVSILKASVTVQRPPIDVYPAFSPINGWAQIGGGFSASLPLLGALYSGATGPVVANKSTNFGIAVNHDFVR